MGGGGIGGGGTGGGVGGGGVGGWWEEVELEAVESAEVVSEVR